MRGSEVRASPPHHGGLLRGCAGFCGGGVELEQVGGDAFFVAAEIRAVDGFHGGIKGVVRFVHPCAMIETDEDRDEPPSLWRGKNDRTH